MDSMCARGDRTWTRFADLVEPGISRTHPGLFIRIPLLPLLQSRADHFFNRIGLIADPIVGKFCLDHARKLHCSTIPFGWPFSVIGQDGVYSIVGQGLRCPISWPGPWCL